MSKEHAAQSSKGKLEYYPTQAAAKCVNCYEALTKLDAYKETVEQQHNTIIDILGEHKVLLDRLLDQNVTVETIMKIFPISNEGKLKEFDPYIRQMKVLIGGNVERNLHHIFGYDVIMKFNVDGTFGKKRLRDYVRVFAAVTDVISCFNDAPDKTLRAAFQRQKKKYFKQKSRGQANDKDTEESKENEEDPLKTD